MKRVLMAIALSVAFIASANAANLIRNAGFETVPSAATGQGFRIQGGSQLDFRFLCQRHDNLFILDVI